MLIAVTCDRRMGLPGPGPNVRPGRPEVFVSEHVVDHLRAVGLTPILLPPGGMQLELVLGVVGGVVITGGNFDIHPKHYGQPVLWESRVDEARTGLELALLRECVRRRIPTLGLCGGMQAMAVALGELGFSTKDELFEKIGLGERLAPLIARRLLPQSPAEQAAGVRAAPLAVAGTEGLLVTYARCCFPMCRPPNSPASRCGAIIFRAPTMSAICTLMKARPVSASFRCRTR